jgi:NAD/NADP transhydrogenase beta subunit
VATIAVAIAVALGWRLSSYAHETGLSFRVLSYNLSPSHISAAVGFSLLASVLATFGSVIFFFLGIATTTIMVHALLRNVPPEVVNQRLGLDSAGAASQAAAEEGRDKDLAEGDSATGVEDPSNVRSRRAPAL